MNSTFTYAVDEDGYTIYADGLPVIRNTYAPIEGWHPLSAFSDAEKVAFAEAEIAGLTPAPAPAVTEVEGGQA